MRNTNAKPSDLAELVYKKISDTKNCPPEDVLYKLFDDLFYISMKTEEGQHINVTITLISPQENINKDSSQATIEDRWQTIKFSENLPFDIKTITKLSKAADPWSSSIAVYHDHNNELYTWGMIDQALHYQSFLNYETISRPDQPGIFQVSITGVGCLAVMCDYELLADFKQNILISKYLNVFKEGDIYNFLNTINANDHKSISTFLKSKLPENSFSDWDRRMHNLRVNILSRILIKIQNYKHGGALLITNNTKKGLSIKYKISYERLRLSTINYIKNLATYLHYAKMISGNLENDIDISKKYYLSEYSSNQTIDEITSELKGAIRYVSSLSCVDGLTVMDKNFNVKGFGTVITTKKIPNKVYLSKTISASENSLTAISPDSLGTRHRSMFSYCWANENSVGFVVSQDGDLRAIKRVNDKLIIWENIKVLRFIPSQKLKHTKKQ